MRAVALKLEIMAHCRCCANWRSRMAFTLHQAFRILRARGITEMRVGLPELEIVEGGDEWAVYFYKNVSFSVDAAGNVITSRAEIEGQLAKIKPKKR